MTQVTEASAPAARVALAAARPIVQGWRLLEQIGEGRWSRIHRAQPSRRTDPWPGDYAVKLLKPQFATSPQCIEMLRREACLGRKIVHPHVAAVLSSQVQRAPHFLVLPYLSGVTLAEALSASAPLTASHALWIARQMCEALAALHRHGWRHGDVKPANVHVSPTGHVTLLDLGLAQPCESRPLRDRMFAGSVAYAAPETFCTAEPIHAVSDVYSIGVMLFEMLTGRVPFDDADADRVAAAHLQESPPDIRSLSPQTPGRAARVIRRMLAKSPLRRPTSTECVGLLTGLEIELFGEGFAADAG
ncbi:MAG: serine/threonine protein kinase [Planctomycetes bacterium]|nr:serine/threonine protein kinase [Planctomycetota bacterium]